MPINIPDLCLALKTKLVLRAQETRDNYDIENARDINCYKEGNFDRQVMIESIKAVGWVSGRTLDPGETVNNIGGKYVDKPADEVNGMYYDAMLRNCAQDENVLGYLIGNEYTYKFTNGPRSGRVQHYVCIVPHRFKEGEGYKLGLIFIDSLNAPECNPGGKRYASRMVNSNVVNGVALCNAPLLTKESFKVLASDFYWIVEIKGYKPMY
jgi:hypothetical protein